MPNKQKAWRTDAAKVNARRANGSREATARKQNQIARMMPRIKSFGSELLWLLMGAGGYLVVQDDKLAEGTPVFDPNA